MKVVKIIFVLMVLMAIWFVSSYFGFGKTKPIQGNKPVASMGRTAGTTSITETSEMVTDVPQEPVTILAFGDLLLDRYIKREIDRQGMDYTFKNLKEFLPGHDLVLANLEGSFTDYKPRPLNPNNTTFTFDPKLISVLTENKFNILSLANNHVQDFGKQGFAQSQSYLDKAGISHFGDFYNEGPTLIKEIKGLKIAFIGYNEFGDSAIASTVAKIKENRPVVDYVIVYAHWGAEYQTNFWPGSQEKGRKFIDAGADIILGGHPHVIQPIEIYNGKPIFYSLGNFVFDQISTFEVRQGLGVKISLRKNLMEFDIYPTEMNNFQVGLANKETAAKILASISKSSLVAEETKKQIAQGKLILNF